MRITAFIGAAVLGLAMLALAPVAMADPAPNICVLDLSQPVAVEHALDTDVLPCATVALNVASAVPITGVSHQAVGLCIAKAHAAVFDFAGHRQHDDPGRCSV